MGGRTQIIQLLCVPVMGSPTLDHFCGPQAGDSGPGIVKTCGLSVGGQQRLPAGDQLRLPGHGHLVTQRADAE